MLIVYGIKNCDSVKKTRKWLEASDIPYAFHDFRVDGISAALVTDWCAKIDERILLNRRSTTWKQLSDADKNSLEQGKLVELLVAHPTLIKRPVIALEDRIMVGSDDSTRTTLLSELQRT